MNPALVTLTGDDELSGRKRKKTLRKRVQKIQKARAASPAPAPAFAPPAQSASSFPASTMPEQVEESSFPDENIDDTQDETAEEVSEAIEGEPVSGINYHPDDELFGSIVPRAPSYPLPAIAADKFDPVAWVKKNPLVAVAAIAAVYFLFIRRK